MIIIISEIVTTVVLSGSAIINITHYSALFFMFSEMFFCCNGCLHFRLTRCFTNIVACDFFDDCGSVDSIASN